MPHMNKPFSFRVLSLLLLTTLAAQAQNEWRAGTAPWNVAGNWTDNSVPGPGGFALIDNGGTATLGVGVSGTVQTLLIGRASGGGMLINGGAMNSIFSILGQSL